MSDPRPITIDAALDAAYSEKEPGKRLNALVNVAASCAAVARGKGIEQAHIGSHVSDFLYRDLQNRNMGAKQLGPLFIALLSLAGVELEMAKDIKIVSE